MSGKNILIIDQSLFMRITIKVLLWNKGFNILEADSQTKAVTVTVNNKPGLILMSLEFAKQNRMKLVRTLKNLHRCPVIVYSDVITKADVISSFTASVDDILLSPLQQRERLFRYFTHTPSQIRRRQFDRNMTELEFKPHSMPVNPRKRVPARTGGLMSWERQPSAS
ncbi:MAG: response regulator [Peptococcaceae bacterium]|nr:response regulator [Peptococcaceae bacterium]